MGDGDKGTEAGENLACSQTAWWSGVGQGYCMFSKGHSATWQDIVAQHPGKLVGLRWLQGGAPWLSAKREAQRENEGPARRLRASGKGEPSTFMQYGDRGTGTPSWTGQGQDALEDSRCFSPAAAPTPTAALAPGVRCSRHHEEQHNWNDVHPLQVGQVDKETDREEGM